MRERAAETVLLVADKEGATATCGRKREEESAASAKAGSTEEARPARSSHPAERIATHPPQAA